MKTSRLLSLVTAALCGTVALHAQCPVVTCPSTISIPCTNTGLGVPVIASANYSANVTSQWFTALPSFQVVSYGAATSTVYLNHPNTYIVKFTDNTTNCVVTNTVQAIGAANMPTFAPISNNNFSTTCTGGCNLVMSSANTQPPGLALEFAGGEMSQPPTYTTVNVFSAPICGNYYLSALDPYYSCISSYSIVVTCPPQPTITLDIIKTLCVDQTYTLTASGTPNYTWSTGGNNPSVVVTPTAPITYTVTGQDNNGCTGTATVEAIYCSGTVTALQEPAGTNELLVYPNPVAQRLNLKGGATNQVSYNLYDASGREVLAGSFTGSHELDISAYSNGFYLLRLQTPQYLFHKRVVVAR